MIKKTIIALVFIFLCSDANAKFTNTFVYRIGGSSLAAGDLTNLGKFDVIIANRFHYNDITADTWSSIRALNPDVEIYLYTISRATHYDDDAVNVVYLNSISRYAVDRGHSQGDLYNDNYSYFLLNSSGGLIYNSAFPTEVLLDVGATGVRNYWIEANVTDMVGQAWEADGVFGDVSTLRRTSMTALPVTYASDDAWCAAMRGFISAVTAGLNAEGQKFSCNSSGIGMEYYAFTRTAWLALDAAATPPDAIFDEGVFAVEWGGGDVQFGSEARWKNAVDTLGDIDNIDLFYLNHTDLAEGGSGLDNYGLAVTYWDALWYALGSFHIGKNAVADNSYFGFTQSYQTVPYYDEYDIDLGNAVGTYNVTAYSGYNIYWREFVDGYIYVNPSGAAVNNIQLPESCKERTHANLATAVEDLPEVSTFNLGRNRAKFFHKLDTTPTLPRKHKNIIMVN